ALMRAAARSIRASLPPRATSAHVVPQATFQFVNSTRLRGWRTATTSSAVGKISSPRWYACRMSASRPVGSSKVRSARDAGRSVYAPGATPQSSPHLGTRRESTVHDSGRAPAGRSAESVAPGVALGGVLGAAPLGAGLPGACPVAG